MVVGSAGASAAPCTNLLTADESTPAGYGSAVDRLTATGGFLVQGKECSGDKAEIAFGSGSPEQYVYKNGLYWTGSKWQELPLQGSTLVSDTWYRGAATGSMPLGEKPNYVLGYVCQRDEDEWKCGCSDEDCGESNWQMQALADEASGDGDDDTNIPQTPQCVGIQPPPAAAEAGFTRLAFCEDFSDPARLNVAGTLADGQAFTNVGPGNIFNAKLNPPSAFRFNKDGTLTIDQVSNNYQAALISAAPTGGGSFVGYAMPGSEWYVEGRMKHANCNVSNFPAFWGMSTRKLYANTPATNEPDFYEYIGGRRVSCIHHYPIAGGNDGKTVQCKNGKAGEFDVTNYFKVGARMWNQGASYDWWLNDSRTGGVSPPNPASILRDRFPILIGNGNQCGPLEVDWIRAWERP